jgi:hypothetical protein
MIDALRPGWPEQMLTGEYTFRTRRRDSVANTLFTGVEIVSDELIEMKSGPRLQIRVDDKPVMLVARGNAAGPTAYRLDPPEPLITLVKRRDEPTITTYDVVDNRLGVVIGRLVRTGGFRRPIRTVIHDATGQIAGSMVEPITSFVWRWLLLGTDAGMRRLTITVNGLRVVRIRQVWRLWAKEFRVDLTRSAGLIDPRLVLACGLQEFAGYSGH